MANKLADRYSEVQMEFEAIQEMVAERAEDELIQEKMTQLEAKQADLKETLLRLIALSKLRDQAWLALSR
jgi:hypothetical protein